MKEIHHLYCSDDELTTDATKVKVLEGFVRSFEISLLNLFNKKSSMLLSFDEFVQLMTAMGFVHGQTEKEPILLRDAWKVLMKSKNKENEEKTETNQIIIFCAAILGLYKGEEDQLHVNKEDKQELIANKIEKTNEEQKETNETQQKERNTSAFKRKRISIPNRFSSMSEHHSYNETFKATNKSSTAAVKHSIISSVLPHLIITDYSYSRKTVKHLKIIFRYFYDSRASFSHQETKRLRQEKRRDSSIEQTMKPSHRFRQSADNYRKRLFDQIETDSEVNGEENTKLSMEELYAIHRKKKEIERAKQKLAKEQEEMDQCTFQPNNDKERDTTDSNIKETINKLYIDGKTKQRARNNEEKKEERIGMECTFSPKVNRFNSSLFETNPLVHDELIRKEVERFERARIERKVNELQKKKGISNIKMFKDLDSLLKEEDGSSSWNFSLEKKYNKESIDSIARKENNNSNTFIVHR